MMTDMIAWPVRLDPTAATSGRPSWLKSPTAGVCAPMLADGFAPAMVARGEGGQIVNVSSLAAFSPQRSMSAYATSKAAVLMFSECLRAELADSGVGVTAICPGVVNTNIVASTRFTGVSAAEEAGKQARFDALYRRRNYPPGKVAARILDAVEKDVALLPVTPESYQGYYASRIAPGLTRRVARFDLI